MIGIYGGTFDPVHYGHLRSAVEVYELFGLDEIRLIPCSQPAHRDTPLTDAEARFTMLSLAVRQHDGLVADRRELDRTGVSYMIDTLKSIRKENAFSPLILFMGADAFKGLSSWRQWRDLFDYAHIVVMTRPGHLAPDLDAFLASKLTAEQSNLQHKKSGYLFFQDVTQLDISATKIRKTIAMNKRLDYLMPDSVIDYIKKHRLYGLANL